MRVTGSPPGRREAGRAAAGDEGAAQHAFARFAGQEWRPLVAFAWSLTGDSIAAEDLVQEALEAAWRNWARIADYDRPGAWARRVVASRAIDRGRRRGREARALQRIGGLGVRQVELDVGDARFWEAVRALPERQAQAVSLHYLEDMSVADIATVLDITDGTVKSHLHRGRLTLARTLGLLDEETDR